MNVRVRLPETSQETVVRIDTPNVTTVQQVAHLAAQAFKFDPSSKYEIRYRGKKVDPTSTWRLSGLAVQNATVDLVLQQQTTSNLTAIVRVEISGTQERRRGEFPMLTTLDSLVTQLFDVNLAADVEGIRCLTKLILGSEAVSTTLTDVGISPGSSVALQLHLRRNASSLQQFSKAQDSPLLSSSQPSQTPSVQNPFPQPQQQGQEPQQVIAAPIESSDIPMTESSLVIKEWTPTTAKDGILSFRDTIRTELWDEDARIAVATLMKLCANVVQRPGDDRVRRLRLTNPAFLAKIKNSKATLNLLRHVGFVEENGVDEGECFLVMRHEDRSVFRFVMDELTKLAEDIAIPVQERTIVEWNAVEESWKIYEEQKSQVSISNTSSAAGAASAFPTFDPFKTFVIGAPSVPKIEISATEQKLVDLKTKRDTWLREGLEDLRAGRLDRQIVAVRPTPQFNPRRFASSSSMQPSSDASSAVGPSAAGMDDERADVGALASHQHAVQEKMRKAETFQTKAMREVDKLSKIRVYQTTLLRLLLPDRTVLQGYFSPLEQIGDVINILAMHCNPPIDPSLVSLAPLPPTQRLTRTTTILDAGLQPAAIVQVLLAEGSFISLKADVFTEDESRVNVQVPVGRSLIEQFIPRREANVSAASSQAAGDSTAAPKPKWLRL